MKTKTLESPIQSLGSFFGNELLIKREDLLPFSFGGNKVRIAQKFFDDMESQNRNSIITYGGTHSNLARIVSNLASARKIPCYIISTYDGGDRSPSSNDALRRISGAKIVECEKKNIAETVETLLENLKNLGYSPYYTHGNSLGIGNESTATSAYAEVFDQFDLGGGGQIFLPVGTGMTIAGLIAGKFLSGSRVKITGICVARERSITLARIQNHVDAYLKRHVEIESLAEISDDFLCGGYGQIDEEVERTIREVYSTYGIALDPIYTGKAFGGMRSFVEKNGIHGERILFIHTGGIPLFFDFIRK